MTTFVLVHGAWGGSYGFNKVRPLLRAAGHEVFTPSLTGIGERSHLAHPGVGLDTHIADVVNTVIYEDLHDIVLLGFSYGGMVVTGALEHIGDRVRHLVFLDALVPDHGESATSMMRPDDARPVLVLEPEWQITPLPRSMSDDDLAAWSNARRSPQPAKTFSDAVHLDPPLEEWPFTRTFIKATADPDEVPDSAFWSAARRTQDDPRWRYETIETNHLIPLERPAELADLLLSLDG